MISRIHEIEARCSKAACKSLSPIRQVISVELGDSPRDNFYRTVQRVPRVPRGDFQISSSSGRLHGRIVISARNRLISLLFLSRTEPSGSGSAIRLDPADDALFLQRARPSRRPSSRSSLCLSRCMALVYLRLTLFVIINGIRPSERTDCSCLAPASKYADSSSIRD